MHGRRAPLRQRKYRRTPSGRPPKPPPIPTLPPHLKVGNATLKFTASAGSASDALAVELPVLGRQGGVYLATSFAVRPNGTRCGGGFGGRSLGGWGQWFERVEGLWGFGKVQTSGRSSLLFVWLAWEAPHQAVSASGKVARPSTETHSLPSPQPPPPQRRGGGPAGGPVAAKGRERHRRAGAGGGRWLPPGSAGEGLGAWLGCGAPVWEGCLWRRRRRRRRAMALGGLTGPWDGQGPAGTRSPVPAVWGPSSCESSGSRRAPPRGIRAAAPHGARLVGNGRSAANQTE